MCLTLPIIRNENRRTMRCHLRSIRMPGFKKTSDNKCWQGYGETGTLIHCLGESKMMQLLWKTVWWFLKKLNIKLPYDSAIPLLGMYPKELKIDT